jgi:hypothetical protein
MTLKEIGFKRGQQMASKEWAQDGRLSMTRESLIHFANGMCYYSMLVHREKHNDPHIDDFIKGFIEGYQSCNPNTNTNTYPGVQVDPSFLEFYFKS